MHLITLHWLPVEERILFIVLLLTFKCFENGALCYLQDLLKHYTPALILRSLDAGLLQVPRVLVIALSAMQLPITGTISRTHYETPEMSRILNLC